MIGHGTNVSINNGSTARQVSRLIGHGGVVVTPLPAESFLSKVLVKAVSKNIKKDPKTFTLRNVNMAIIRSPDSLKGEIKRQFNDDIVNGDFEVGYVHSNNMESLRIFWTFGVTSKVGRNMFYGVTG